MKRNYRKSILRTVRSTLSRFLAIFAIVALGVGFLAGLLASPDDMRLSADAYYDDTDTYDIRVVSTLGLTEADLASVKSQPGVEAVLPVWDRDLVLLSREGDSYTARMHTLPQAGQADLNRLVLQAGRLPEAPGECAVVVTKTLQEEKDWIGETLTVEGEEEGAPSAFTVVGVVKSALYLSMEREHTTVGSGTVGLVAYTVPESFDTDYYTGFYLGLAGAKEKNSFRRDYEDQVDRAVSTLEALGEERSEIRYQEIVDDAREELDRAREELEEKRQEAEEGLADARQKLEDAEGELEENEEKLADALTEIQAGREALAENRQTYETQTAQAQQQLDAGAAQIAVYQAQLDQGRQQLLRAGEELEAAAGRLTAAAEQLRETQAELDRREEELAALEQGKAAFWQAAGALGLPAEETSDAATLAALSQLEILSPESAAAFAPLRAGLEALAAQGTDTAAARALLEEGRVQLEQGRAQTEAGQRELEENRRTLEEQTDALDGQQAALDTQKAQAEIAAATLRQTREETEERLAGAQEELDDAQRQYDRGMEQLAQGRKDLEDGRKSYEDSRREAEEKLQDGADRIAEGEKELEELELGRWYVLTRRDNAGYASYSSNADKIAAIATVFPAFFFLVAALVALTTMTRMVEEERQQIGTLKALGYSSGQIAAKYLLYAAFASVLGSGFGLAVGMRVFPSIIIAAYNIMYDVPRALTPFHLRFALLSSLMAVACVLLATLSACWAELREAPARLMLPKAPKAGKRVFLEKITPLWRRMKFTHKVAARNLIRYKKRFFMTVIGISGCTALLVTGFGIKNSISDIVTLQYQELNHYQLMVGLADEAALQGADLRALLDGGEISAYLPAMENQGRMVPREGDPADSVVLFVPARPEELPDYVTFRHRLDRSPVSWGEASVIVTEKLAERQHLQVGETVTVENQEGRQAAFTVTDICENYVSHYLYLSPDLYREAFGEPMEVNTLLCRLSEGMTAEEERGLSTRLIACPDVSMTLFTTELSESFEHTIRSLDSIVLVLIFSAGALAFVVLYNLTNINISERVKEIATIKVLGFYDGEVSAYIYRENAVLTLIGAACGLVLGVFLHQFVIRTAEVDLVMFGRAVYPQSFLWSALLTVAFSVLVNLVMHRKLKKISMVESMKAPE